MYFLQFVPHFRFKVACDGIKPLHLILAWSRGFPWAIWASRGTAVDSLVLLSNLCERSWFALGASAGSLAPLQSACMGALSLPRWSWAAHQGYVGGRGLLLRRMLAVLGCSWDLCWRAVGILGRSRGCSWRSLAFLNQKKHETQLGKRSEDGPEPLLGPQKVVLVRSLQPLGGLGPFFGPTWVVLSHCSSYVDGLGPV